MSGLLVSIFFLGILIWGIPKMTPYPANPFFLFSFFSFTTYLGVCYINSLKDRLSVNLWDVFYLFAANGSTMIWYKYLLLESNIIFLCIYLFLILISLFCWLGYLFVTDTLRFYLRPLVLYLFLAAIFYYNFYPFGFLSFKT